MILDCGAKNLKISLPAWQPAARSCRGEEEVKSCLRRKVNLENRYEDELREQMELKKRSDEEQKRKEREEEERLDRRTREQQERMKREFDEETNKKKAKEEAVS